MLKSLRVNLYNLENKIIADWSVNESFDITPNYITFILNSPTPNITQNSNDLPLPQPTGISSFANVTNTKSHFIDILPNSFSASDIILASNINSEITVPNTTTTLPNTTTTLPNTTTTTFEYKNSENPKTRLYQKNFDGSSNIYSPYIYHNM